MYFRAYHNGISRVCGSRVHLYLDKFSGLGALLESGSHLVWGERDVRVDGYDVLFDRLNTGAVALLEGLDGFKNHLRRGTTARGG